MEYDDDSIEKRGHLVEDILASINHYIDEPGGLKYGVIFESLAEVSALMIQHAKEDFPEESKNVENNFFKYLRRFIKDVEENSKAIDDMTFLNKDTIEN